MALTVAAAPERISEDAEPIPSLADADIAAAAAAAADCRVEKVMVFGSVARGEARHGSDIDLLVLTADCTPADLRKIECTLPTAAWEATGLPVDVVVERRVAFEYLSRNVTASFEYAVAAHLMPLWQAMPLPEPSGNLDGVPRDNLDVAATDAQGSARSLGQLATLIGGIPRQEARIANDPSYTKRLSATHRRIDRNIGILENAYQSIERSAAAIRASVDAQRVAKHELDLFVWGLYTMVPIVELADRRCDKGRAR